MRFGLAIMVFTLIAGPCQAVYMVISTAAFGGPTRHYKHAALGDDIEYTQLNLTLRPDESGPLTKSLVDRKTTVTFTLPPDRVFEDTAPRVVDVDGDGVPEVIVVETDVAKGASLAIYTALGKITATAFLGGPNRWLAPAGVGDFNGDGQPEIAYVDQPHARRDLVFVQYGQLKLVEVGHIPGLTNHRFGDRMISGGTRNCGAGDEVILANPSWTKVMVARLDGPSTRRIAPRSIGPLRSEADFARALICPRHDVPLLESTL